MKKYTANEIMAEMNDKQIFVRKDYTYIEYVEQLIKFQQFAAELFVGGDNAQSIRMSEVVSRCETIAREYNLYYNPKITTGIKAMKLINKEISVAMAGKCGEDRVANTYQYVKRPDARFYRNVYINDGVDETELDTVVLTKNGFIILEIKNAKDDITLAADGRILFNNSTCYHDISIGDKMDKKRRLLRSRLEKEFKKHCIDKPIIIDGLLVFSTPTGVRINIHDQYKKENYCFRGSLFNRIDGYDSNIEYSVDELDVLDEVLQHIETEQKRFLLKYNPEEIKIAFAEAFETLAKSSIEEKNDAIKISSINKHNLQRISRIKSVAAFAVASIGIISGVGLGMASRINKINL